MRALQMLRALPIVCLLLIVSFAPSPAAAGDLRVDGKLISDAASGPPLAVTSSERVDNLNADQLDGFDATAFAPADHTHAGVPYAKVIVVSPSGGDFTSIQAAIDSITGASAANPYLIWVGPGVYEEVLTVGDGIDLHGAGRNLVTVRNPDPASAGALVTLQGDGELRSLTVESSVTGVDGTPTIARGIYIVESSPRLVDVAVRTTVHCGDPGVSFTATGIRTHNGASPTLERVSIEARVTGSQAAGFCNARGFIPFFDGVSVLDHVTVVAEGTASAPGGSIAVALNPLSAVAVVRDSVLVASGGTFTDKAIQATDSPDHVTGARVAHSQLIGGVTGADIVCIGAYDADFAALGAGCT